MLGSMETSLETQFLPSRWVSLRVEEKRLPNWQDPSVPASQHGEASIGVPSPSWGRSQRVRRLSSERPGLGLFPIRTERQWSFSASRLATRLYLPNFLSPPEACHPGQGVQPLSGLGFLPGDTRSQARELERLSHGGLIPPPPPPRGASSGCCR